MDRQEKYKEIVKELINATDVDIGEELVEAGIQREQIVLGLVLPQSRKLMKYGQ